jgi:hypothetical protein
VEDYKN